jgi:hypothetical protein
MRRKANLLLTACAATVVALVAAALGVTSAAAAGAQPFAFLAPGFTQALYATGLPFAGGVAFAPNGDPLVAFGSLYRIDSSTTVTQNGSTIHPTTQHSANLGLGLANSLDGSVYANLLGQGVVKIDPGTGSVIAGPFGAAGNELGIALDPQTHNLVYAGSDGRFYFVSPDFSTQGVFSTQVAYSDGIAFDPTGSFLFTSSGGMLAVLDRNNNLVQQIALANGACCTDGIAFHSVSPQFVISNNTDGTITRYDFPGNDYTKAPAQSILASGGFRGDILQVAADGCAYLMQGNTRFADGTVTNNGSLVQLCPGFAPPVGGPPPDGYLQFTLSSAMIDLYDQTGTKLTATSSSPGTVPSEHGPIPVTNRTYTFSVAGGTSTIWTTCTNDNLNCSIVGIQYDSKQKTTPTQDLLSVQYYRGDGGYTSLNQQVYIGNEFEQAEWNAGPNTTTLKHVRPSPATSQTLPGMVLLQIWTKNGNVVFNHS